MFSLGNVLYFGGIAFFVIGAGNLIQCVGQSAKKIAVCVALAALGIAGFWFGDDMRRNEVFSYTIDHYQDGFAGGDLQVFFEEETTPRMIKKEKIEKFKEMAAKDGNPNTIDLKRADKKELFR